MATWKIKMRTLQVQEMPEFKSSSALYRLCLHFRIKADAI